MIATAAPGPNRVRSWPDALAAFVLLAGLALYVARFVDLSGRPEEDAAMLLRYAQHLAHGDGIVWNPGEAPVDGATDFLFMVLVAALHRAGVPLERAARGLGLAAHAATVLLVYLGARRRCGASVRWAIVPAAFVAIGPGLRHLAACYGTPLFTLSATVTWLSATALADAAPGAEAAPAFGFALAALALGLARPEGVLLGGFTLLAVLLVRRGAAWRPILARFLSVFLTLGLAYFGWRWLYFGHPLPNPFYKKGAFVLHWHTLSVAWRDVWRLGLPFAALLPIGLLLRTARRAAVLALAVVVPFVAIWILISDETNYVGRFRYPIVPALVLGSVPALQALARAARNAWPPVRRLASGMLAPAGGWLLALASLALVVGAEHRLYRHVAPQRMGLYDAALVLHDYARRDFTLATTEAGLLPLYSDWHSLDAWGLNDPHVARAGLDESYLERYRPEVILIHAFFSPGVADHGPRVENRSLGPPWYRMTITLRRYAETHGYALAACFGRDPWDTHYYYVRRGFAQSQEILERLRALDYYWDGQPTLDFGAPERAAGSPVRADSAAGR